MTQHLLQTGLLHVQDLTLQGENRLDIAVAPGLGRTTSRVPFNNEDLSAALFLTGTVPELARQIGSAQGPLAPGQLACLARSFARGCRLDGLVQDTLGIGWMLFSIGAIILLCFGMYEIFAELYADPAAPLWLKIGLTTLCGGAIFLLVSFARERLFAFKRDRYREVDL